MHLPRSSVLLAGILILAVLAYLPGLGGGFVYDDHRLVERNPLLDEVSLSDAFAQDLSGGGGWQIYRPLVTASFMVERVTLGFGPRGMHVVGLLWHLAAVAGLFWLVGELTAGGPWSPTRRHLAASAAALLFAIHPLQSEAVIWISRRADVMAGALALLALAAVVRWRRGGSHRWAVLGVVLTGTAFLAKEIAVALPLLVAATLLVPRADRADHADCADRADGTDRVGQSRRARVLVVGLTLAWLLPYLVLREMLFGTVAGQPVDRIQNWIPDLEGVERVATLLVLVGHAVGILFAPLTLSADYSWRSLPPATSLLDPHVLLGMVAVLGVLVLVVGGWRRSPLAALGGLMVAATYLPVSNWVVPIGVAFAERLFYLPMAGVALAVSSLPVPRSASRRRAMAAMAAGLILALTARTFDRARDWRDDTTLFEATLDAYPENLVALTYVAIGRMEEDDLGAAADHYRTALRVDPDYHLARVNLALIHLEEGDAQAAAREARIVVERDPGPGAGHLTLGRAELALGNREAAEREMRRATADPRTRLDAWLALTDLHLRVGEAAPARETLARARALDPRHPGVRALERALGGARTPMPR